MATELSIETSEPTFAMSSSSHPGALNTSCGATLTSPSAPFPRLSFTTWNWLFSPPSKRKSLSTSPLPSQSSFHFVGDTSSADSFQSSVASGRSIASTR
jgi:hypothetical protein